MDKVPDEVLRQLRIVARGVSEYLEEHVHEIQDAVDINCDAWDNGGQRSRLHRNLVEQGAREAASDLPLEVSEEQQSFDLVAYEGSYELRFRLKHGDRSESGELRVLTKNEYGLILKKNLADPLTLLSPVPHVFAYFPADNGLLESVVAAEQDDVREHGSMMWVTFGPTTVLYPQDVPESAPRAFRPGPVDDDLFGGEGDAATTGSDR